MAPNSVYLSMALQRAPSQPKEICVLMTWVFDLGIWMTEIARVKSCACFDSKIFHPLPLSSNMNLSSGSISGPGYEKQINIVKICHVFMTIFFDMSWHGFCEIPNDSLRFTLITNELQLSTCPIKRYANCKEISSNRIKSSPSDLKCIKSSQTLDSYTNGQFIPLFYTRKPSQHLNR